MRRQQQQQSSLFLVESFKARLALFAVWLLIFKASEHSYPIRGKHEKYLIRYSWLLEQKLQVGFN